MLHLSDVLLLGDPMLRKVCDPVTFEEISSLNEIVQGMHGIILEFRKKYNAGRAIAAPQVGCLKRLVCLNIDDDPKVFYNPFLTGKSDELIQLWDDCMSFPNLLINLKRHKSCTLNYKNESWEDCTWKLEDDLSELFQHELDHLEGILCIDRAIDKNSFKWRK